MKTKYIDTSINPADYIEVWEVEDAEHGKQLAMAVDDLKFLPPADVRPVKRGRWIQSDFQEGWITCSECERLKFDGRMACSPKLFERWGLNYCPNCGADMRGGDVK